MILARSVVVRIIEQMTTTTLGADLADMDRNVCDWPRAFAIGVRFAYLRADFSTTADRTYELEAQKARDAGIRPGPYFFPDERITAKPLDDQIAAFAANVRAHEQPGDLPAAFDVEYSQGIRATGRSRPQLLLFIIAVATKLRAALGYWPVEYSSKRVIDGTDTDTLDATHQGIDLATLKNCPFWASRYVVDYRKPPIGDEASERAWLDALPLPPIPAYLGDAKNVWMRQTQGDSVGLAGFSSTVDLDIFFIMRQGETGERVTWAQQRLGMAEATPGVFDGVMAAAVRQFQTTSGLDADEAIGIDTWCYLAKRP